MTSLVSTGAETTWKQCKKDSLASCSVIWGLLGLTSPVSKGTETTYKRCKKDKFTLASRSAIRGLLGLPALEIVIGISLSNPRFLDNLTAGKRPKKDNFTLHFIT